MVLDKILINTQTGYVPGRNVANNARMMEEIIEKIKKSDLTGYFVRLDAQKAFDSVSHEYLEECLRAYNFPETYIEFVKTIYKDLESTVMVNGFTGKFFKILRSVKQGDALSCALFVIAIDPLLRAIENSQSIKKIKITQDTNIASASYADDITGLVMDKQSIESLLNLYGRFAEMTGIELNLQKTEIMKISNDPFRAEQIKLTYKNVTAIIHTQEAITVCGLTLSTNSGLAYEQNIKKNISKMERQLNIWKQRNLTLEGRNIIVKTFGISQLIFTMQQTTYKSEDIKKTEDIIYKFIWNKKPGSKNANGRIKKQIVQQNYENGGLNMPNIDAINQSLKYKHILKAKKTNHPIKKMYEEIFEEKNFKWLKQGKKIKNKKTAIDKTYLETAMDAHESFWSRLDDDYLDIIAHPEQMINKDYHITLQTTSLKSSIHVNKNQAHMIKKLEENGIKTLGDLGVFKQNNTKPNLWYEIHQLYHSFPNHWKNALNKSRKDYRNEISNKMCIKYNTWIEEDLITTRQIRSRIMETNKVKCEVHDIINKHKLTPQSDIDFNPFILARKSSLSTYHRTLQYKILQNIYPKNKLLHIWKIKESPNCSHCDEVETLKHVITECEIAKKSFENLVLMIKELNPSENINKLTQEDIIFGIKNNNALSHMILITKSHLLKQKDNEKRILEKNELHRIMKYEFKIEEYISNKSGNKTKLHTKWKKYFHNHQENRIT